jgi:class 3 adenylate cyclase/tetratricopeptide (TPR) repeat protein
MQEKSNEIAQVEAAIAALSAQRSILGDAVVDTALGPLRDKLASLLAQSQPGQQRKLATVLFADVSGFTALSEMRDAEVVAAVMNDLWAAVDRAILGHGGHIDKHIGDAVMALWGIDGAREDDPEMAVRGALAMQAAVVSFCATHDVPIALRIGVNTGLMLIGAMGTTGEITAMGEAVNLASRLETAAPVGGVLISHDTYRHIRGLFDVLVQEPLKVKGKADPVRTYVVARAKPRAFRQFTRGVEGVETQMIGRDRELLLLQSAFNDAVAHSETRLVTIVGEAGVGKSRLLYEFDNWLELHPSRILYFKGRSTANLQNVPHSLFRDLFAFRFDIRDSDSTAVALAKFQAGMQDILETGQADVIGHWLGFDFGASAAVQPLLGSGDLGGVARAHLTRYFRTVATVQPVVLLLEDIHWADDQSLDLVGYLAAAVSEAQFLLIALSRPMLFERRPDWGKGQATFHKVELAPLPRHAGQALVDEILQRVDSVPDTLRNLILDTAEGNPFYIEEMVKMLMDRGVIVRSADPETESLSRGPMSTGAQLWHIRPDRLAALQVPSTLTALLQARLDSLSSAERAALQRAAVVGRLFWDGAVADLSQIPLDDLRPTLAAVRQRELIFRREHSSFAEAEEYVFKHNLLRDVAYETVLLKYRTVLHSQAARWLESHAGERRDEYLGLIAEHYIQADEGLKAADLLERSGYEAISVGAFAAARRALERGLALREAAGETDNTAITRALIALGESLVRLGDYPAAEAALERGLAGARAAGDWGAAANALSQLAQRFLDFGLYDHAEAYAADALHLARQADDAILPAVLMRCSGVAWRRGNLDTAEALTVEALTVAHARGDVNNEISALNTLGIIAGRRREQSQAAEYFRLSLAMARAAGNLSRESNALANLGVAAYECGDYETARTHALASLTKTRELGELYQSTFDLANLAQANLKLGDVTAAREGAREVITLSLTLGTQPNVLYGVQLFAEILAAEGQTNRALLLYGLARAHPALEHQSLVTIDEDLSELGLSPAVLDRGLATGAALDLDTVVAEILDGKW